MADYRVLCTCAVLCSGCIDPSPPPGFDPPADAVEEPGEIRTFVTRLENPLLGGRAPLRLAEMTVRREPPPPDWYPLDLEWMEYQPDGVRVRSDAFTDGSSTRYAWLDVTARTPSSSQIVADLVQNWPFRMPSISLPFGGAPRTFVLETIRGRELDEPPPGGTLPPPLGFEVTEVDRVYMRLAEDVLVVPVHATIFAGADGRLPYLGGDAGTAERALSQMIDPGASTERGVVQVDNYLESRVMVQTALNVPFDDIAPDGVWSTCGIQFHLEKLEVVPQQDGLERDLIGTTNPCGFDPAPLSDHFAADSSGVDKALGAVPLFIGGTITADLGFSIFAGITCGPVGVSCDTTGTRGDDYIAIDAFRALHRLEARWTLAHELGHFLGLDHEGSRECAGDLAPDNLMRAGGPESELLVESFLTPEQCRRARCLAAYWLSEWRRADASLKDTECAGL